MYRYLAHKQKEYSNISALISLVDCCIDIKRWKMIIVVCSSFFAGECLVQWNIFFVCTWCVHFWKIRASRRQIYRSLRFIGHSRRRGVNSGSIGCSGAGRMRRKAAREPTKARSDPPVSRSKSTPPGDGDSRSRQCISSTVRRGAREASICHYWPVGYGASASGSAGASGRWASLWFVKCLCEKKERTLTNTRKIGGCKLGCDIRTYQHSTPDLQPM